MKTTLSLLSCLTLAAAAPSLSAALIFDETFDYPSLSNNTNLGGNTGGTWLGGTNNVRYRNAVASYVSFTGTGYVPTHGGGFVESGNTNSADYRGSNAALGVALSGEFWISAFVNPFAMTNVNGATTMLALNTSGGTVFSSPGGPGFGLFASPATGVRPALFTGAGPAGVLETAGEAATLTGNIWYLLVARVNVLAAANDSIDLWVFGADAAVPTTIAGLGTPLLSSNSLNWGDSINTLHVGGQSFTTTGGKTAFWDDLRVSDLGGQAGLGEVLGIPEPSTYAALLTAGVFLLVVRRRLR